MLKFLKNIVPFAAAAGCLLLAGGCSRTMYPQGQHRRDLQPPTDAVLCYGGSHHRTPFLWDKERLAPYVTYVDKEGTEHWLFDGFIFLEFQDTNRPDAELYAFETGHLRDKGESAGKAQWQELIDYYFTDGNGVEALEEAVKEAAARFDAATERMALAHLPYARRFSSRSVREGEDPEDVFQTAFIGLQRATRRFDPARGRRFVVFAAIWMHQTIGRWRAEEGAEIRLPVHRGERLRLLDQAISRLDLNHDRTLTDAALAAALEWSAEEVALLRRIPRLAFSPESAGDWDEIPPQAGTGAPEAAEEENSVERTETTRIVAELLEELPERDAEVIRMRFGFGGEAEMTLEEIGQLYGLTRERIRQIEARALRHLAHPGRRKRLAASLGI